MDSSFLDTNILSYSADDSDPVKRDKARALLRRLAYAGIGTISSQGAVEFASNLVRKLGRTPTEARRVVKNLETLTMIPTDLGVVQRALEIMGLTSISFWDAAIIAAAEAGGCRILYSEDLNPGQTVAGMRIVNPFL